MEPAIRNENYAAKVVILSTLVSIGIYGSGYLIMYKTGILYSLLYLLYIAFLEYRLIKKHCANCYYYGKTCAFGKGRISALLFKKGDTKKFCPSVFNWKDLIPDILVSLIPVITGIVLLIIKFNVFILLLLSLLLLLTTKGNELIRGKFACKYCKQAEIGCSAYNLFNKVQ
jgi:hypothetical protein